MMNSLTLAILSLLFFAPCVLSFLSLVMKSLRVDRLIRWLLGLEVVGMIALIWIGEETVDLPIVFLGHPISLSTSLTALLLCLALLVVLFVLLEFGQKHKPGEVSRTEISIIAFAVSAELLAFFSNQFMIRYIALELVGLLAALSVGYSSDGFNFSRFSKTFLTLRLGDLGLLAAILIIQPAAGTLIIPEMVSAASLLPSRQYTWAVIGFLIAGVIKMGIFPFSGWQRNALSAKASPVFWVSGFLMPALGMYLLYRVRPVLDSVLLLRHGLVVLGVGLIAFQMFYSMRRPHAFPRFSALGSVMNGFVLLALGLGSGSLLRDVMLGLMVSRLIFFLQGEERSAHRLGLLELSPIVLNLLILLCHLGDFSLVMKIIWMGLAVLVVFWDRLITQRALKTGPGVAKPTLAREPVQAEQWGLLSPWSERLDRLLEMDLFSKGIRHLAGVFIRLTNWLHSNFEIKALSEGLLGLGKAFNKSTTWFMQQVERRFDKAWIGLGDLLAGASSWCFGIFENRAERKAVSLTEDLLRSVETGEEKIRSRSLRQDLIWIPMFLLIILAFLYFSQRG